MVVSLAATILRAARIDGRATPDIMRANDDGCSFALRAISRISQLFWIAHARTRHRQSSGAHARS